MAANKDKNLKINIGGKLSSLCKDFDILFSRRNWRLISEKNPCIDEPDGPMLYHIRCKRLTVAIFQDYPECESCNSLIPNDIATLYVLCNIKQVNNESFFLRKQKSIRTHNDWGSR